MFLPKSNRMPMALLILVPGMVMTAMGGTFFGGRRTTLIGWIDGWPGVVGNLAYVCGFVALYCHGVYEYREHPFALRQRYRRLSLLAVLLAFIPVGIAILFGYSG